MYTPEYEFNSEKSIYVAQRVKENRLINFDYIVYVLGCPFEWD